MTLNASGPISLGGSTTGESINLELGLLATAQISLNDTAVRTLAGVASGAITIPTDFYGKSTVVVTFNDFSLSAYELSPNDATCWYRINSNGNVYGTNGGVPFDLLEQWVTPTSFASDYEVYATLVSGSLTGGTTGAWLSLGTTREWYVEETGSGTSLATLSFDVRKIGTTTVLDTWTINLEATVDF